MMESDTFKTSNEFSSSKHHYRYQVIKYLDSYELFKKIYVDGSNECYWSKDLDFTGVSSIEELIAKAAIAGISEDEISFENVNRSTYNGA